MKNTIKIIAIILVVLSSCSKNKDVQYNTINGEWLLTSGEIYLENMETGDLSYYDHFGDNRTISSTDLDGSNYPMEVIIKDVTKWEFNNDNFLLNDTLSYDINYERYSIRVFGMPSAKIIEILVHEKDYIKIKVDEKYEAINGYNTKYYSILKFKRIK